LKGFSLASSDNPQFEPQPLATVEPQAPVAPDPLVSSSLAPVPTALPPIENPVWSGWDVLLIAVLTLALSLFIVPLLIVLAAQVVAYPHESWMEVARKPALALLSELLSYIVVAVYMILLVEGKYHQRFWQAIRWNWGSVTWWMLGVGMLTVLIDVLGRFLPMPKTSPFDEFFSRPRDAYLTAIFAVTIGPLMEELFFRGFFYPVLARKTSVAWAVVLTALPFGLIHYVQYRSWGAVLLITLVGVVLGTVRAMTKSVAASFVVHVGYNGTLMALAAVATDGFRHMERAMALVSAHLSCTFQ
jgi:membrane protease YdiL (CAAX protease family)